MKKVRENLGYSQNGMAYQYGLTVNAYRKIEKGDFKPGHYALQKMVMEYDISLDWLFFNKGPMVYKEKQEVTAPPQNAAEELTREPGLRLAPEVKIMVEQMEKDPKLYHEILAFFHRFQTDQMEPATPKKTDKKKK
jgi:transcriptional regulator with XRE-family HTH domain